MLTVTDAVAEIDRGLVDRGIFSSTEVYEGELERVFARCWLFVAHESQLPNPNDFVTSYMGEDPIIVWRDRSGKVRAFLNMCRHRGTKLCLADGGNTGSFMCTYHGWNYRADGSLASIPGQRELYGEDFDLSQWGLVEVAQLTIYKGLVFATFDPSAPPLETYFGPHRRLIDFMFDRSPAGTEVVAGVHKWLVKANWKYLQDNVEADDGHHTITHASVRRVPVNNVQLDSNPGDLYKRAYWTEDPSRLSEAERIEDALLGTPEGPMRDFERARFEQVKVRLGLDAYRDRVIAGVFPNCGINSMRRFLRVHHPRGPLATEIWSYAFVDRDAPQAVKDSVRHNHTQSFGPAGNVEQDDMRNFQTATETARGHVARRYPQVLMAGLTDRPEAEPGRRAGARLRGLYKRWALLMQGRSWSELDLNSQDWR